MFCSNRLKTFSRLADFSGCRYCFLISMRQNSHVHWNSHIDICSLPRQLRELIIMLGDIESTLNRIWNHTHEQLLMGVSFCRLQILPVDICIGHDCPFMRAAEPLLIEAEVERSPGSTDENPYTFFKPLAHTVQLSLVSSTIRVTIEWNLGASQIVGAFLTFEDFHEVLFWVSGDTEHMEEYCFCESVHCVLMLQYMGALLRLYTRSRYL